MLGAWRETAQPAKFPARTYNEANIEQLYVELNQRFRETSDYVWDQLYNWIRFQFGCKELVDIFWLGGNEPNDLKLAAKYIRDLDWGGSRLLGSLEDRPPDLLGKNVKVCREFDSPAWFALAYTFHAFTKGRFYAHQLAGGIPYHPHWLRKEAIHHLAGGPPDELYVPTVFFPWGEILSGLLEHGTGAHTLEDGTFRKGLDWLRSTTLEEKPMRYAARTDAEHVLLDFAETALSKTHWMPERSSFREKATPAVRVALKAVTAIAASPIVNMDNPILECAWFALIMTFILDDERRRLGWDEKHASLPVRQHEVGSIRSRPAIRASVERYVRNVRRDQTLRGDGGANSRKARDDTR